MHIFCYNVSNFFGWAWVQCKHMYYILQNIIYCGWTKKIIHYPIWSWDKIKHLMFNIYWHKIKHVKTNDMIITCCICIKFFVHISFTLFIGIKMQLTMLELVEKFKGLCRKNEFIIMWSRDSIQDYVLVLSFLEELDCLSCGECFKSGAFRFYNKIW
jgi:hypothetical protein